MLSDQEWDHGAETVPRSAELRALQKPNWGLNKDLNFMVEGLGLRRCASVEIWVGLCSPFLTGPICS